MNEHKKVAPSDEISIETLDRVSDARNNRLTQQTPLDTEAGDLYLAQKQLIARTSWQVFKNQARAMWLKNYALQSKAKGTNCCQITTPLICLFIVFLIKIIAQDKIADNAPTKAGASPPFFFDVNYQKAMNLSDCLQWYLYDISDASPEELQFTQTLLENIPAKNLDFRSNWECESEGNQIMPYFQLPTNSTTTINQEIFAALDYLNTQNLNMSSNADAPGLSILPDGAITFDNASIDGISFNVQINDNRIKQYHRNNGVTKFLAGNSTNQFAEMIVPEGQLGLIGYISQSALNLIDETQIIFSGSMTMPNLIYATDLLNQIFSITGASLYPLALSLLLPVFMYSIVLEKEERLQEMMKMNGLRMLNYWCLNYLWNFTLYFIAVLVFVLFGFFILDASFFTQTSFGNLFFMLIGWGLSQVSLGFFFQTFISKARTATIVGYILSIWTTMLGISFNFALYPPPKVLPPGLRFYPPFAFCRLIYDYSQACANNGCYKSLGSITDEMVDCMLGLYLGAIFFMALAMYLHAIWPKEYGIQYHPLFCLKRYRNKQITTDLNLATSETLNEDEDSKREKDFVNNIDPADFVNYPLIIKSIRKVYKSEAGRPPKVAVKNFSLHIKQGEMFGLLGPNGAGKTTLISMLTGLYPPEAGNAWVAGFDILNQIDEVRREMGVCPQFDLLWPELTIAEHLYFYARVRGVPNEREKEVIEKAASEVKLGNFLGFRVRQLSGGMKRRLSVAISLVGDPKVVFLDEPTTGLDPENRRQLWDILTEARGNRAVVLTTHSMDEADVLCNRIGIITDGVLRCIGPQTRLKTLYGGGYHLFINCCKNEYTKDGKLRLEHPLSHYHSEIDKFVHEISPKANLKASFNGNFIYLLPLEGLEVSRIFEELENKREKLAIEDWGISQSTLEDVFMEIVNSSEQANKHTEEHN